MTGLLGGAFLSGLLSSDGALHGRRLGVHRDSLLCAFHPGFCCFGMSLRGLGIGDGLDAVGLFALLGLGLLELALGGQRVVAGHSADEFLRLALDRVDQTLTRLVGFLVLTHRKSPLMPRWTFSIAIPGRSRSLELVLEIPHRLDPSHTRRAGGTQIRKSCDLLSKSAHGAGVHNPGRFETIMTSPVKVTLCAPTESARR